MHQSNNTLKYDSMKILAILAALFLSISYGYAQTYEKFVEKSFDFLDKNDLDSAEESLRAAMRLEPGNPNNYALLMNLGTIQQIGRAHV